MDRSYKEESCGGPIFILGVMQRSGTNFINNLLLAHPDCGYPGIVWEDFFLAHADLLKQYSERVKSHWKVEWCEKVNENFGSTSPLSFIGWGLVEFMRAQQGVTSAHTEKQSSNLNAQKKFLVTATPSVDNLELFFDMFEDSRLLIIIRDGRAVVESGVRSFDWDYEGATRRWEKAARRIIQMDKNNDVKDRCIIVRYEDLFVETEKTLTHVFKFLGLDPAKYNYSVAQNIGVMGSSELRQKGDAMHWKSVDKPKEFNPLSRADNWNKRMHERFAWIVGDSMEYFGYKQSQKASNSFYWRLWNRVMDIIYSIEIKTEGRVNSISGVIRWLRLRLLGLSN